MNFSNTYLNLGSQFFEKSLPTPVQNPQLFLWNSALAQQLNIAQEWQNDPQVLAQFFSGNQLIAGSTPIATAYAGHQFGHFNPQLGDGRAHLLGEVIDQVGHSWDLQLKGSGPTPYSRGGDGRCAIGPAVREFIMSEAMHALGVPSTRCLAVVTTGEGVFRNTVAAGAVVTRVASSHLRVGTFQFFAARGDNDSVNTLCDYAIEKHFPELKAKLEPDNKYILLLDKIIEKQIELIVEWMRVGFIHGVMNTDNTAISGETIDYGPCAMLGVYDPKTVYSSIDRNGRYAFGNQAEIAHWNIIRLAECILPLIDKQNNHISQQLESLVQAFPNRYQQAYIKMMSNKMGILIAQPHDEKLISSLLDQFTLKKMDYTNSFDLLTQSLSDNAATAQLKAELGKPFTAWQSRIHAQSDSTEEIQLLMQKHNPVVIPRNHHIEAVLQACEKTGDAATANDFLNVLRQPYKKSAQTVRYQNPADDDDINYQTFCGT